ncbi:uncharacterized protein PRCAT00005428001 [Priceomyces carsonii]|uniref:uncharacterized protein n=1 Tax=Priceomyces carsonii TaxID=28549 RepID=UPI002EDA04BD|nr:unnamed protein product [Priceomyces carsonii]
MQRPIGFTLEDEGAKKKWDAWKREEGLTKTEAKRRYISYLIDTMKVYANGTLEARELLSELEYLWDQIKDLPLPSTEEGEEESHLPLPSHSPLFSAAQSDRYSTMTPSISNQQYRNNLQKIYSHSRRNTLSINDYVQQQRDQQKNYLQRAGLGPGSTYSLPVDENRLPIQGASHSVPPQLTPGNIASLEDFKTWQGEINLIINKLSKEYLYNPERRREGESENSSEDLPNTKERLQRRMINVLKFIGLNGLRMIKSFSFSLLALLFILWVLKKNVVVRRTFVVQPGNQHTKLKRDLVINMTLNTRDNKWFIRILNLLNRFVGFV